MAAAVGRSGPLDPGYLRVRFGVGVKVGARVKANTKPLNMVGSQVVAIFV